MATVLNVAPPEGRPVELPILTPALGGPVSKESVLALANSPYRVTRDVTIEKGGSLLVEPGVRIEFSRMERLVGIKYYVPFFVCLT